MDNPQLTFLEFLAKKGMAATGQRRVVLEVFLNSVGHFSCEEFYMQVSKVDSGISSATIYRTVKLLEECEIAEPLDFGDGVTRFECKYNKNHHDHLVCVKCGKRVEVIDERIEELQEKLARKHLFRMERHRMILYGICSGCKVV